MPTRAQNLKKLDECAAMTDDQLIAEIKRARPNATITVTEARENLAKGRVLLVSNMDISDWTEYRTLTASNN